MADKAVSKPMIPQTILRNLCDRSYDKRKQAAVELEHFIKEINLDNAQSQDTVKAIINLLVIDFTNSTQSANRKGGLIGLAATGIALMDHAKDYLAYLLPPVFKCFSDPESRVRYYACEALYNITKVARTDIIVFFNEIFDCMCRLHADPDMDVKSGAQLLDRLMKDVVTESQDFDVERFIPLLRERISIKNAFIRQLLVGWITVLGSVPDIDMLEFLPEFLGGLLEMLSDPNKDIRQQVYAALAELLREISECEHLDLGPMIPILVQECESRDNFTRLTVLTWMFEFLQIGKSALIKFCSPMLGAVLMCISDPEKEIRNKAQRCNEELLNLVEEGHDEVELEPLIEKVTYHIGNKNVSSRLASLRWLSMLLTKMRVKVGNHMQLFFPALLNAVTDTDEQVVRLDLEVLARLSLDSDSRLDRQVFEQILKGIIQLFHSYPKLLEDRGSLIVRQLSVLLEAEAVFTSFAILLLQIDDIEFVSTMVQCLNLIMLTSVETFELRRSLRQSMMSEKGRHLFISLFKCWSNSPVASLSLCLLAEAYELASSLTFLMADFEVTVGFLLQLDKLVQLIESPIFIHLRLQLLEPVKYTFLLKSLYGVLMLLPQSTSFTSLKTRLESVTFVKSTTFSSSFEVVSQEGKVLNFKELLDHFVAVQAQHQNNRKIKFKLSSLIKSSVDK